MVILLVWIIWKPVAIMWRSSLDEDAIFDIDYSIIFLWLFYQIQQTVPFVTRMFDWFFCVDCCCRLKILPILALNLFVLAFFLKKKTIQVISFQLLKTSKSKQIMSLIQKNVSVFFFSLFKVDWFLLRRRYIYTNSFISEN